jgi:putative ABC transport system permease protein
MKLFTYIFRNITRNKIRSVLTILSVGFSLALMTVLYGFMASQETWKKGASQANRIVVMNVQGFSGKVPIAMVDDVRATDGVVAAVPYSWFGGTLQEETMPFAEFATDADQVFEVWPEIMITDEELKAWKSNRQGCVVDRRIAEKRNWKIGQRVPLKGTFFPVDLDLELMGTFDAPKNTDSLWFHWKYLDESLKAKESEGAGNSGTIFARVDDPSNIPNVIQAVDDRFASSDTPTRSQTEAAFAQMFVDMLGNVQVMIRWIGLLVVLCLSLVAANSMAMAMRERVTEIAVLKAIGFSGRRVLVMVLGEAFMVSFLGGLLGVAMGCGLLHMMHLALPQQFPFTLIEMMGPWITYGFFVAGGIGLISGLVPAIQASRLSVIDGLRRVT